MIHPSYSELIEAINTNNEDDDEALVLNSRYSLVLAASKRARQLIAGAEPLVPGAAGKKPLSVAIDELYKGKVKILPGQEEEEEIEALEAEKMLEADGIHAEIINIHTIKPIDRELVVKSATKTGKVVTVEEHSVIGGLGSAVCEVLSEEAPTKVLRIGVNDVFGESGPALELIKKYGLDAESIYKKVKAFVK